MTTLEQILAQVKALPPELQKKRLALVGRDSGERARTRPAEASPWHVEAISAWTSPRTSSLTPAGDVGQLPARGGVVAGADITTDPM
ncbi:MAG: hypothetical protein IPK07_27960 [Deltaproteobacteria bacterium]|nr:hypothetical protein [Deltaproteobacteria bacterium]